MSVPSNFMNDPIRGGFTRYQDTSGIDVTRQVFQAREDIFRLGDRVNYGARLYDNFPGWAFRANGMRLNNAPINHDFYYNTGTNREGLLIPALFLNRTGQIQFLGVQPFRNELIFKPNDPENNEKLMYRLLESSIRELDLKPTGKADQSGNKIYTRVGFTGEYIADKNDGGIHYAGGPHRSGVPLRPQVYYRRPEARFGPAGFWHEEPGKCKQPVPPIVETEEPPLADPEPQKPKKTDPPIIKPPTGDDEDPPEVEHKYPVKDPNSHQPQKPKDDNDLPKYFFYRKRDLVFPEPQHLMKTRFDKISVITSSFERLQSDFPLDQHNVNEETKFYYGFIAHYAIELARYFEEHGDDKSKEKYLEIARKYKELIKE